MDINVVMLLIGLAVVAWSFISRRKKKKRAAGKSASRPDLISLITEKIRRSVAELERRAATAPEDGRRVREVPDPWAQLGADESPARVQGEDILSLEEAIPEWEVDVVEARAEAPRQGKTPPAVPPVASPAVPEEVKNVSTPGYLDASPHSLRSAVVWSEILAPPLALRKDDFR